MLKPQLNLQQNEITFLYFFLLENDVKYAYLVPFAYKKGECYFESYTEKKILQISAKKYDAKSYHFKPFIFQIDTVTDGFHVNIIDIIPETVSSDL